MNKLIGFSAFLFLTGFISCEKADTNSVNYDCTSQTPTYANNVKAIIDSKCAFSGCHNAGTAAAGINLSDYANVSSQAEQDRFIGSIEHLSGYSNMPRNGSQLSTAERQTIYCWIQTGKPQ